MPLFLKIAPDLQEADLEDIAAEVLEKAIEGVIVSNTTISRPALKSAAHARETGGLSGRPLFERSTMALAKMRRLLGPDVAIIGVGGVDSAETALEKIRAGRRPRPALHRHDLCRTGPARPDRQRLVAVPRQEGPALAVRNPRQPGRALGGQGALESGPQLDAQRRKQAQAAAEQEDVQRRPEAAIAEGGREPEARAAKTRNDAASCCACRATRSRR